MTDVGTLNGRAIELRPIRQIHSHLEAARREIQAALGILDRAGVDVALRLSDPVTLAAWDVEAAADTVWHFLRIVSKP